MHEALFRVKYDSLYSELTEKYNVTIKLWCNTRWDAIYISGPESHKTVETITEDIGLYDCLTDDGKVTVFTEDCLLKHGSGFIEEYLESHKCRLLPPFKYESGDVFLRLIAQELEQLTHLFNDLQEEHSLTVEMKRTVDFTSFQPPLIMPKTPQSDFSERQEEALKIAYKSGYYELPRSTTTKELANQLNIDRRTFEDHLRRAERKLTQSFAEQNGMFV